MNLISIIIPVYNAEKYIHRCIRSVVNQSHKELEIIAVNDGSTDDSLSICETLAAQDNRIKVFSQKNGGVSKARNTGLRLAKGEYVMFLDSDDYMLPDMCKTMLDVLHSKQADCVICGIQEPEGGLWCPQRNIDYSTLVDFKKDFIYQLNTELLSPCWNKIFKRQLITNLFNEDISFGEDLIFCLNYLKNCTKVSFVTDTLLFHEKNVSGSLVSKVDLQRLIDIEKVHIAIINFVGDLCVSDEIHDKYIRDLAVYSRKFIQNFNLDYVEKTKQLILWRNHSYIDRVSVRNLTCSFSNKLLLFLLKHNCWYIAETLVNKKFRF